MKAILLNDTDAGRHIGCELVIRNTRLLCEQYGIEIIHSVKTRAAMESENQIAPLLNTADLILLNGEGTLHDDKPRALALLKAAGMGKAAGLKTVLYNSIWDNNPIGQQYLPNFDLIYCRDSHSSSEIRIFHPNLKVQTVADMIFTTQLSSQLSPQSNNPLISDSVKKDKCFALAKFAVRNRLPFVPMGSGFHDRVRSSPILKWKLSRHCNYQFDQLDTPESFAAKIQSSSGIVTGRFHAACFALLLETPVCCLSSNTRKIESLFSDFGLSPELVEQNVSSLEDAVPQWQEQIQHRRQLNQHIEKTRKKIHRMFEQISQL